MSDAILLKRGGGGIDVSGATAQPAHTLSGKTFYAGENEEIQTGTMSNYGATNKTLKAGESITISTGYHSSGKITAETLASQTAATATAPDILSGKTAYKDGVKLTGTMPNRGTLNQTLTINGTYTLPAGYYPGGTVKQSIPTLNAKTYTPTTGNQTIVANQYLTGIQTIAGDSNLIANNIKKGITIFGVIGNMEGKKFASGTATPLYKRDVNYANGNATTSHVISVSGLTFKPSFIIAITTGANETTIYNTQSLSKPVFYTGGFSTNNTATIYSSTYDANMSSLYVNSTGFCAPVSSLATQQWFAFE